MKTAYLDCFSGVSGDMFLGALIAAGVDCEQLRQGLAGLGVEGYGLTSRTEVRQGIACSCVAVEVTGPQPSRLWPEIRQLLINAGLPEDVRACALDIFLLLARAEAAVHGCGVEEVHFHEVGAVDALIDIVGTVLGLQMLGIDRLVVSPLPISHGWVECQHGSLPLPAPAVCELLVDVPVYGVELGQELVTPTGAALVAGLAHGFGRMPALRVQRTGYGGGSMERADGRPNLLRLVVGETERVAEAQEVEVIETNIDDCSPELFPYLYERLHTAGALDVSLVPIQMKKGRPGFLLRVIVDPAQGMAVKEIIVAETSAIGVRFRREARMTLARQKGSVDTRFGPMRVKLVEGVGGPQLRPEYEECRRLALAHQIPLQEIYLLVAACPVEDFMPDPPQEGA